MKISRIEDMEKGWFIGNFEPSVLKTKDFEVGIVTRFKGPEKPHYHAIATEYNLVISGSFKLNKKDLRSGDIFIIEPGEVVYPFFYEETKILSIKVPSVIGDKYEDLQTKV